MELYILHILSIILASGILGDLKVSAIKVDEQAPGQVNVNSKINGVVDGNIPTPKILKRSGSNDDPPVIINGGNVTDVPSANIPPTTQPPVITTTTAAPPTNGTTPTTPPTNHTTTVPTPTTTTTPSTTTNATTTTVPTVTTPTTTRPTNGTPTTESTTPAPTSAPSHKDRRFDGPSFIGGIILASGLMAIGFVSWKFYKARTERNYHTL